MVVVVAAMLAMVVVLLLLPPDRTNRHCRWWKAEKEELSFALFFRLNC